MLGEIRRTKRSGLDGGLAAAAGCLIAWIIFGREGMTFAVGTVFFLMYGFLTDRNDRMVYDDQGIILYTVWGKAMPYDWSRIIKVDTAVEQLRERRFIVGLVLRICVKERIVQRTRAFDCGLPLGDFCTQRNKTREKSPQTLKSRAPCDTILEPGYL